MSKTESLLEKLVKTRLRRVAVFTVLWVCVWFFGYMYVWYNVGDIAGTYWAVFGWGYFIALVPLVFLDIVGRNIKKYRTLYFLISQGAILVLYQIWGIIFFKLSTLLHDLSKLSIDEFIIKIGELLHL